MSASRFQLALVCFALVLSLRTNVRAQGTHDAAPLRRFEEVADACQEARSAPGEHLYSVDVENDWTFGTLDQEGLLTIEPRRVFRALGGQLEVLPSRMERVALRSSFERFAELERAHARGIRLRLGFFLGFEGHARGACVLRPRAVSTLRIDVAFVELVDATGGVIAREDHERFRAWMDDPERIRPEPRVAISRVRVREGSRMIDSSRLRDEFQARLNGGAFERLARCYDEGRARGGAEHAVLVLELPIPRTADRPAAPRVVLSDFGDEQTVECVRNALAETDLTSGHRGERAEVTLRFHPRP